MNQEKTNIKSFSSKLCVLVNSLDGGGGERVASVLFDEYRKQGVDVVFVCLEKNDFYHVDGEVHYLSNHTGKDENPVVKLLSLVTLALKLKKLLALHDISCVQSHLCRSNYVNVLAKLLGSRHKSQIVNHGILSRYGEKGGVNGAVNFFLVKWLYRKADQIVLACREMMTDLQRLAIFQNEMLVINNPFDLAEIEKKKEEKVSEDEFVFADRMKYVITVGRLESVKHVGDVVNALKHLNANCPDVELILLGDGSEKQALMNMAKALGLEGKVHFLGQVSNPYTYIARSNVLVSASESEGFGNVLVEALACGTAVVSTDCIGGPREIIAPGSDQDKRLPVGEVEFAEYGILTAVGDSKTLAGAIKHLLDHPEKLGEYAAKGVSRAQDFDQVVISQRYLEQIERVMVPDAEA